MSDLIRFGVSLEKNLLEDFDRLIGCKNKCRIGAGSDSDKKNEGNNC